MAHERFLERDEQPSQNVISKAIGREVLPVWEDVTAYLDQHYPNFKPELFFYNPQEGWAFRYRKESQQLCVLFPEQGGFTALISLNPEEETLALDKINYFNARIRDLLNRPSTLPQGRWLWMRLEDYTDFVGLKLLLDIKMF